MAKKKSSMDPGMEDDGNYGSGDYGDYSDEDSGSPGDYGAAPNKTMRKSAAGRSLKRWSPGEDQLLLLFVDQVCMDLSVALPWDAIARAMEPRPGNISGPMTGEAVKQHLAKLRTQREEAGQVVPPKVDRATRRRVASLSIEQLSGATPRGKGIASRSASTGIVKRSSLLAPLNKREQAAKNRKDAAEAAKIKKEAAEEKIKHVPVFKTPAKKRNAKVVKAGARDKSSDTVGSTPAIASRNTSRSTGQSTGTKRARGQMAKVDEGGDDIKTPTKRPRLRPAHGVNYAEQEVGTPGGQEDEDEYQEEIDATEERFGKASLASGGRNTANFRGNSSNAYSGGFGRTNFNQDSGPPLMTSMTSASMAPAMNMTPTTNFPMACGQTMDMYENMDYAGQPMSMNSQYFVGPGSGRGQSGFEGSFDGSAGGLAQFKPNYSQSNAPGSMYRSAPGAFNYLGGLPGSSGENYGNQMCKGLSQNASFLEDCDEDYPPHLFQQTPALPSIGYGRPDDQQQSSFDSGIGSSLPQSPAKDAEAGANDHGMDMGMSMSMDMSAGMGAAAGGEFDPFMGGTAFDDAYHEHSGMKHERGSQGHDYSA